MVSITLFYLIYSTHSLIHSLSTLIGNDFPHVTIRDTVKVHLEMIKNEIGATSIASVIGGSMGGMQALEWCIIGKELVKSAIIIGCGTHSLTMSLIGILTYFFRFSSHCVANSNQ